MKSMKDGGSDRRREKANRGQTIQVDTGLDTSGDLGLKHGEAFKGRKMKGGPHSLDHSITGGARSTHGND